MIKNIFNLLVICVFSFVSCDVDFSSVVVSNIKLDNSVVNLNEGETKSLTATILPENAKDKSIIWKSDNESVATVDNNGLITAKGKGIANITVSSKIYPSVSAYSLVNVSKILTSINIIRNLTLTVGESFIIKTNVLPKDASDTSVIWKSSNEDIATISAKGEITPQKQGSAGITATSKINSALSEVCILIVTNPF